MSTPQQSKRLSALYRLLLWEGGLGRRRVMDLHGLSGIRASQWIRELKDSHPEWLSWDAREKAYRPTNAAFEAIEVVLMRSSGQPLPKDALAAAAPIPGRLAIHTEAGAPRPSGRSSETTQVARLLDPDDDEEGADES